MAKAAAAEKATGTQTSGKSKSKKEKALVIVESPAKSKTIRKILGDSYTIEASFGHIRDLPQNVLGFDVNKGFEPSFVVIPEKKKVVTKLNDLSKKSDKIFLASDPDREGEAIAWHVRQVLNVPDDKVFRIEFNEITPKAVKYAVEHPRAIDMDRVKAQQTRQILDKLVGYKLSPVLWKRLGNYHLSAGRVQSVALRMIVKEKKKLKHLYPLNTGQYMLNSKKKAEFLRQSFQNIKIKKLKFRMKKKLKRLSNFLLISQPNTRFQRLQTEKQNVNQPRLL